MSICCDGQHHCMRQCSSMMQHYNPWLKSRLRLSVLCINLCFTTLQCFIASQHHLRCSSFRTKRRNWKDDTPWHCMTCHGKCSKKHGRGIPQVSLSRIDNDNNSPPSPTLWLSDLVAICLASELVGLLDTINDPTWLQNGGWLQPVSVPTSLSVLVIRIAVNAITWVISSLIVEASFAGDKYQQPLPIFPITAILFCTCRVLLAVITGAVLHGSSFGWITALRDCYTVILTTAACRYIAREWGI